MFDKLRDRFAEIFEKDSSYFFTKFFFLSILAGLFVGLIFTAILFLYVKISFSKNAFLFFLLTFFIALGPGIGFFVLLRSLLRRGMSNPLKQFDFSVDGSWGYLLHSINSFRVHEAKDGLLRLLEEERLAMENYERNRALTASQFGVWLPDAQLDKILEDENFYAIKGRQRETFVVVAGFRDGLSIFLEQDPAAVVKCFSQLISAGVQFAKKTQLVYSEFSPDFSIFCADLPYALGEHKAKKMLSAAQAWRKAVLKYGEKAGFSLEPFCLFHYGTVQAGKFSVGYQSKYQLHGLALDTAIALVKNNSVDGICLTDAFCEAFLVDTDAMALGQLAPDLYQVSD